MCTGVVNSPKAIPAISAERSVHQNVLVQVPGKGVVSCRGGINAEKVQKLFREYQSNYFMYSYLDALPDEYHNFNMACVNKSIVELR